MTMTALRPRPGECPTGCGRGVRIGQLMCSTCWRQVPKDLQADVNRTWRAWRRDWRDEELMRAWRDAADRATAAVT